MNRPHVNLKPHRPAFSGSPAAGSGSSSRPPSAIGGPRNLPQRTPAGLFAPAPPPIEPLALRPADAARAIGVCERLLRTWTQEQGVPHVLVGKVVMYPVRELREWLRERISRLGQQASDTSDQRSTAEVVDE